MSTSSITNNVVIDTAEGAERLLSAIDQSAKYERERRIRDTLNAHAAEGHTQLLAIRGEIHSDYEGSAYLRERCEAINRLVDRVGCLADDIWSEVTQERCPRELIESTHGQLMQLAVEAIEGISVCDLWLMPGEGERE